MRRTIEYAILLIFLTIVFGCSWVLAEAIVKVAELHRPINQETGK
jgi:hypothetical protein